MKHKIVEHVLYAWRRRFGTHEATDMKRTREAGEALEAENAGSNQIAAERDLEIEVVQETAAKMASAPTSRRGVAYAKTRAFRNSGSARLSPRRFEKRAEIQIESGGNEPTPPIRP